MLQPSPGASGGTNENKRKVNGEFFQLLQSRHAAKYGGMMKNDAASLSTDEKILKLKQALAKELTKFTADCQSDTVLDMEIISYWEYI